VFLKVDFDETGKKTGELGYKEVEFRNVKAKFLYF